MFLKSLSSGVLTVLIVLFSTGGFVLSNYLLSSVSIARRSYSSSSPELSSSCITNSSLHQLALDMFQYSSPPASPSLRKLKHVLEFNTVFFIGLGSPNIFSKNQESIARMLQGYGLRRTLSPEPFNHNVTLVETKWTLSLCPITEIRCQRRARVYIQSEQYFGDHIRICHESPNCIILEFSEYNYHKARTEVGLSAAESFVLLPIMTQYPSRMSSFVPTAPKKLKDRMHDIVFFGAMTGRRKQHLPELSKSYLEEYPNRSLVITTDQNTSLISSAYKEAKVCLIIHSYSSKSGGEYHRLSEFAPFGCIPVMETFSDRLGADRYEQCGGVVFADLENLTMAVIDVIRNIDGGYHEDRMRQMVDWWGAGIQWEQLLPTVFA